MIYYIAKGGVRTDFYDIKEISAGKGVTVIYPDFKICKSKDLMVRGHSFYAVWDEEAGLWSTNEYDVQRLVDQDLYRYYESRKDKIEGRVVVKNMQSFSSGIWKNFKEYVTKLADNSHQLDEKLTFSNSDVNKKDYVSKRLPYPLQKGEHNAYDEIINTLYDDENREKIEWGIGSIISGDSRSIQKFEVFYGDAGTGKSTILNIVQKLFEGYYTTFEAKALTSSSNSFATEVFKSNPLVAIQHDGDLSRIEDNTKLNSIVSHEEMIINEKYKASYTSRVNCFLFMATNRPVKITDAKSGIIRRLIDINPTGKKIPPRRYQSLMSQIDFELGAIAYHCLEVYQEMGKHYYDAYRPLEMMLQTDVFFNFVEDRYYVFKEQDGVSLTQAYEMYKTYCDEALVDFKLPRHKFRDELRNYFKEFYDVTRVDGIQVRSYYKGFISDRFTSRFDKKGDEENYTDSEGVSKPEWLVLERREMSLLDGVLSDCCAQYANERETPFAKWDEVTTKLRDIDTSRLHYVKVPENHIVIDFDLKNENGEKDFDKNFKAASKWPPTYAEVSKSEKGIHLHYTYIGDTSRLSRVVDEGIELKVFNGNSSLRRKLSTCNNLQIAEISSGLPLKKETKMINSEAVKSERSLRDLIERNLKKEIHPGTKPSVDFIYKILEDSYNDGLNYDVTDMRPRILAFANNSTHQAKYCVSLVSKMKFKSEEPSEPESNEEAPIVFFDVEVFPNLFLVNWKYQGPSTMVRMINPTPQDIEPLFKFRLIAFNNRRYDNHILYARYIGYTLEQLFELSQRIIAKSKNCFFSEAYNLSYTDIYDFLSAGNKMSLKAWECKLHIHHQELGLPWDQPVPEELWPKVSEYCDNDVKAAEEVFNHNQSDWLARQILADLADMTVNDTTNSLTTRIIFGKNKNPQNEFNYRDLSKPVTYLDDLTKNFLSYACPDMMNKPFVSPISDQYSLLPYFPDYTFENGKSIYRGVEVGEGGYVYSEPGMYYRVALLDVKSMHPHSAIAEAVFGIQYTKTFRELVEGRVAIKDEQWAEINDILGGKLTKYIDRVRSGELKAKDLANALKTAINSVYGLTAASFTNAFKDPRNKDNIVAKRGALFMVDLMNAVKDKGYTVAHIKTDSIKIPEADKEIIEFVKDFGRMYGYEFDHEATYDRMCLVNDAVYIARYSNNMEWTATGAQFAQSYVFKTLFSKEPLEFWDFCEEKSVNSQMYLDMNEGMPEGEHNYIFIGRTALFCPIKPGCGGGQLMREKDGKYYAVTGTKGYRWLESEVVQALQKESDIDRSYYDRLVDQAIEDISEYGDFEKFVSDDRAPWTLPCGSDKYSSCISCPNYENDTCCLKYSIEPVF